MRHDQVRVLHSRRPKSAVEIVKKGIVLELEGKGRIPTCAHGSLSCLVLFTESNRYIGIEMGKSRVKELFGYRLYYIVQPLDFEGKFYSVL